MAETITSARVRIACHTDKYDQLLDQRTGKPVVFWGGNDIDFDIGVFFGNEPANLSNLTSISLEVKPLDGKKPPSPDTTPLMSKTVTDITATITQAGWDDYSEQHCVISFTDAESNLEAGNYWIVVSYLTNAGKIATIGAGVITIKQDGTGPVLPPDPIDPPYVTQDELENYYLKTQADARYLQIANNLSDLDDAADARANLGLAKLQPAPYSVVVHNGSVSNNRAGKLIMAYGDGVVGAVSPQSARSAIELDKDQAADDSIVTHDGTVTNANTDQITEVDSNGKVRASGKSFGATVDDLFKGRSNSKIASINELMFAFGSFKKTVFNRASCTDEFTGSGAVSSAADNTAVYSTGTTAGSLARIRNTQLRNGPSIGGNIFYLPKNRPHFLRWFVAPGTEYGSDGFVYCTFGKPSSSAAGPINDTEYVGFRISGASRSLSIVHNAGTGSETVISTGVNLSNDVLNSLILYCDGGGATCGYRAYRNGVFVGSFSHVSGLTTFSGPSRIMTEVYNGTDTTDRSFCYFPSEILVQGPT